MDSVTLTVKQMAAAFEEWDRQYREDPDAFQNPATVLLFGNPQTYGEEAANFFYLLVQVLEDKENDIG